MAVQNNIMSFGNKELEFYYHIFVVFTVVSSLLIFFMINDCNISMILEKTKKFNKFFLKKLVEIRYNIRITLISIPFQSFHFT